MRYVRLLCITFLFLSPSLTIGQDPSSPDDGVEISGEAKVEVSLPALPDAGLTPASPFFFLEQIIERVGDALTFNPDAKAKRQAGRALERIAEVKAMLAEKGVAPKGLDIALRKIEEHAGKAAGSVQNFSLAKELDGTFETHKILLKRIIEEKKQRLREEHKERKDALHRQLTEKLLTRSDDEADDLEEELVETESQTEEWEDLLDDALDAAENTWEEQEKTLEQALDAEERQREEFERTVRAAMKANKKALHEHLKELRHNLKDKEHALREQLQEAIELGEDTLIEQLTETLTSPSSLDASIATDIEAVISLVADGEARVETSFVGQADVDIDALMARERMFLDHLTQGADRLLKAKNKARESALASQKKALELRGKRIGHEIVERRRECLEMDIQNLGQCIAERARTLQGELEEVALEEKIVEEEQENLPDESSAEERQFDETVMMRKQALETLRTLKGQPERLVEEAQKLSERAQEAQKEWQEKMDLLKEERKISEENLRQRMMEGKEVIRADWQKFLQTEFDPEELKAMQDKRRMEQKQLLEGAQEERAGIREEFKEGMRDVKEERGMMKEEMKEERQMMKDDAAEERSEKQRLKEEEMRDFMEKQDELLKEQQREADRMMKEREQMMKEREQMMKDKTSGDKKILPPPAVPPPPDRIKELPPVKPLLPRYPSRDIPDRRGDEDQTDCVCSMEYAPVCGTDGQTYGNKCMARCAQVNIAKEGECSAPPPKRPTDENPPPPKRDDDRSDDAYFEGKGEAKGEVKSDGEGTRGGVQFEFEGKGGTNSGR